MKPGQKRLDAFCRMFPFWAPRVSKWKPSGLFGVKIWLTDGNVFIFSDTGKRQKLMNLNTPNKKGEIVYDSAKDHRKGL